MTDEEMAIVNVAIRNASANQTILGSTENARRSRLVPVSRKCKSSARTAKPVTKTAIRTASKLAFVKLDILCWGQSVSPLKTATPMRSFRKSVPSASLVNFATSRVNKSVFVERDTRSLGRSARKLSTATSTRYCNQPVPVAKVGT